MVEAKTVKQNKTIKKTIGALSKGKQAGGDVTPIYGNNSCRIGPKLVQHYPICWYTSLLHAMFLSKGMSKVMEIKKSEHESYYDRTILRHDLFKTLFQYRAVMESNQPEKYEQLSAYVSDLAKACISIPKPLKMSCLKIRDKSVKFGPGFVEPCYLARKFYHDYNKGGKERSRYTPGFDKRVVHYAEQTSGEFDIQEGAKIGEHLIQIASWLGLEHEKDFMYYEVKNYKNEFLVETEKFMEDIITEFANDAEQTIRNMKFIALNSIGIDEDKEPLPLEINIHGQTFLLDSASIGNSGGKDPTAGHAVAGITCPWAKQAKEKPNSNSDDEYDYYDDDDDDYNEPETRYVVNSWKNASTKDFDWANESFVLTGYSAAVEPKIYWDEGGDESDYYVFDNFSNRVVFYVNVNIVNAIDEQSGGKQKKEYIKYRGHRYLVRHGSRGSKHIVTKSGKVYLSRIAQKQSLKQTQKS